MEHGDDAHRPTRTDAHDSSLAIAPVPASTAGALRADEPDMASREGPASPSGRRAWLFDAARTDVPIELGPTTVEKLEERQLLWIDIRDEIASPAVDATLALLPLDGAAARRFLASGQRPRLRLAGTDFELRVLAAVTEDGRDHATRLDVIAGPNFVVTIHAQPIPSFDDFADRLATDTAIGSLDSGAFVAVLLDEFLTGYLELSDALQATVDRLDRDALQASGRSELLNDMVALRHRIAAARRALTMHREVIAALGRKDFEAIVGTSAASSYLTLAERFQHAIEAIDGSREALVGTFDIHMTRTAQRTNDIVKTLTIASVILLPAGVISGFMGMNETPPYSIDDPRVFWVVVLLIVAIAGLTLGALRARHWM
jgi:magnesium transporter